MAVRFLEMFQIAPVTATRERGEWKRLYVYTIVCKPRDESSRKNVEIVRPVVKHSEPFSITACIEDVPFAKLRVYA
jgi:hypothetical protein